MGVGGVPSESQLVLLCLDYLRDLRRSYGGGGGSDLLEAEGLDPDYVSLAAWALGRAFVRPAKLRHAAPREEGSGGVVVGAGVAPTSSSSTYVSENTECIVTDIIVLFLGFRIWGLGLSS